MTAPKILLVRSGKFYAIQWNKDIWNRSDVEGIFPDCLTTRRSVGAAMAE